MDDRRGAMSLGAPWPHGGPMRWVTVSAMTALTGHRPLGAGSSS